MARINKSLYRPSLLGGIERGWAVLLGVLVLLIIFFGSLWSRVIGISLIVTIWSIMAYANSLDYIFFRVLFRHLQKPNAYIAHTAKAKKFYRRISFKP
ncbi:MAG: VirB3 family type IV secretion system protein [Neisseriaceae bacterium]|jgi:type IV secretory pathway TrbD component